MGKLKNLKGTQNDIIVYLIYRCDASQDDFAHPKSKYVGVDPSFSIHLIVMQQSTYSTDSGEAVDSPSINTVELRYIVATMLLTVYQHTFTATTLTCYKEYLDGVLNKKYTI